MNQQIKGQWVTALRSGEYQQTTGHLRRDEGFCCLGVLSDLYLKEHGGIWFDDGSGFWYIDLFNDENTDALLPKIVADWAGLHSRDPSVFIQWCGVENLSQVNDRGSDFKTIANLIEKQL